MGELHHPVEGEWKNFIFKMIQKEDINDVLQNLRDVFCKDEPIAQIIRLPENPEAIERLTSYAEVILKKNQGLSFVVRDKATGKIAGIRVTYIVRSDDHDEEDTIPAEPTIMHHIQQNLSEISEESKVFEKYGISEYADLLYTSVDPEYRGQGLVTEIYRRALALLRSRKIFLCKCIFTSPATHKVGIRNGFEELARRRFLDFNDGKGNQILPTASPDQMAVLMVLKL